MTDLDPITIPFAESRSRTMSYVLITPARNEARYIEKTLRSVTAQTQKPLRWIIVNDGSTDETSDIIAPYLAQYPWIEEIRIPPRHERDFAGKVRAFNVGYARVRDLHFDCVASLDADISFSPTYFAFLLAKLAADERLGLVGTPFREGDQTYDYRFVSIEHVSGACQLFRRECFEQIGGYVPSKGGGVDHVAVLKARMNGWKTRTFTEMRSEHHRAQGSALRTRVRARLHVGRLDYALGGHPLWEVFRGIYQMTKPPFVLGGLLVATGYFIAFFKRAERSIPDEMVRFRQAEQMRRLRRFIFGPRQNEAQTT